MTMSRRAVRNLRRSVIEGQFSQAPAIAAPYVRSARQVYQAQAEALEITRCSREAPNLPACRFPRGRHAHAGGAPPRGRAPRRGCHRRLTTLLVCAPLMIGRTLTDRRGGCVARPAGVISPRYAAMPISKRWRFAIRCRLCPFSQHQRGHKSQAMRRCAPRRSRRDWKVSIGL